MLNEIRLHPRILVVEVIAMMRDRNIMRMPVYQGTRFIEQVTYDELMGFLNHKEQGRDVYYHKLNFDLETALVSIRITRYRRTEKFKLMGAVAVLLVLCSFGLLFFKNVPFPGSGPSPQLALNPNKQLILTLGDGKQIVLDDKNTGMVVKDNKLTYRSGKQVACVALGDENSEISLSIPRGKTYQLMLADGTKVWLNAHSNIRFPAEFKDGQRTVKLKGEGYFEVARKKHIPFVVESKGQKVEVLGTHFNVSSYEDEKNIETTLLEGSVKVLPDGSRAVTLKPGQQSVLKGKMPIAVSNVETEDAVSWMKGEIVFRNERLEDILISLAHWYDMGVVYQDKEAANLHFSGTIIREANVTEALKVLELTGDVDFKVSGKKILVRSRI